MVLPGDVQAAKPSAVHEAWGEMPISRLLTSKFPAFLPGPWGRVSHLLIRRASPLLCMRQIKRSMRS